MIDSVQKLIRNELQGMGDGNVTTCTGQNGESYEMRIFRHSLSRRGGAGYAGAERASNPDRVTKRDTSC